MSFNSDSIVKSTRKIHRCAWCEKHIQIGQRAVKFAGIWEGDLSAGYFHLECDQAFSVACADNGGETELGGWARGRTDDDDNEPPQFKSMG